MGYSSSYNRYRNYGQTELAFWRSPLVLVTVLISALLITFICGAKFEPKTQAQNSTSAGPLASINYANGSVSSPLNATIGFDTKSWAVQYPGFKFPGGGWRTFLSTENYALKSLTGRLNLSSERDYLEIGFGVDDKKLSRELGGYYALRIQNNRALLLYAVLGEDRVTLKSTSYDQVSELTFKLRDSQLQVGDKLFELELPKQALSSRLSIRTNLSEDQLVGLVVSTLVDGLSKEYQLS